jgi:hypothetical protein
MEDGNLLSHARRELKAAGMDPDGPADSINTYMAKGTLDLLRVFSEQGHSGASAPFAIKLFATLAAFEPWGPIRGTEDEWMHVGNGGADGREMYQNTRCSRVFRNSKDGPAYDVEGIVFRDPDGCCVTTRGSAVLVDFPYTPKTVYVDRDADGNYTLPDPTIRQLNAGTTEG